jgi:protein TonB
MKQHVFTGGASLLIAFTLFILMHFMIKADTSLFEKKGDHTYLNFVRVKPTDQTLETKQRKLPDEPPPPEQAPSAPQMTVANNDSAPMQSTPQLVMQMPSMSIPMNATGGPVIAMPEGDGGGSIEGMGEVGLGGSMDSDVVALMKVPAVYPYKAKQAKLEGYVKLKIVIRPDGTVSTATVIESQPKRLFDQAAKDAILQYKFKPRTVDGQPVQQIATQVIEFKLSQ